jgi:hypothetical protein
MEHFTSQQNKIKYITYIQWRSYKQIPGRAKLKERKKWNSIQNSVCCLAWKFGATFFSLQIIEFLTKNLGKKWNCMSQCAVLLQSQRNWRWGAWLLRHIAGSQTVARKKTSFVPIDIQRSDVASWCVAAAWLLPQILLFVCPRFLNLVPE